MSYLFTSESVSEGHPDKIADQISDAILDNFLALDPTSKVAVETLVTTNQVVLAGEINSIATPDIEQIVRETIQKIGYEKPEYNFDFKTVKILNLLHRQSPDIARGVKIFKKEPVNLIEHLAASSQGAGDQGLMFGYACNEMENYIPLTLDLSHTILKELAKLRKNGGIKYLRPNAKAQVTIRYSDNHEPLRIDTVVISTQHDYFDEEEEMLDKIKEDIFQILIPKVKKNYSQKIQRLFSQKTKYHINPTGKFVIGGPDGDTGLTGRKIIVDTYGGKGAHGGGAFSGKDPSKVDRSGAYMARYIAKNLVAAGVCDEVLVQVSYAIGVAEPCGIFINTFNTCKVNLSDGEIAKKVESLFDLRPFFIERDLKLRLPIYSETASYGHMGRKPKKVNKIFKNKDCEKEFKNLELFSWEKLDRVGDIKREFNIE